MIVGRRHILVQEEEPKVLNVLISDPYGHYEVLDKETVNLRWQKVIEQDKKILKLESEVKELKELVTKILS